MKLKIHHLNIINIMAYNHTRLSLQDIFDLNSNDYDNFLDHSDH